MARPRGAMKKEKKKTRPKKSQTMKKEKLVMKRGPAASLPGKLWAAWTQHLLATGPTWVWVAVVLTHILCCRITEVLSLRKRDFDFKKRCVTVRALKRQPQVQPQFGKAVLKTSVQHFILTNQPIIKISIIQPNMGLIHPFQNLMGFPSFLEHTAQCTWTCTCTNACTHT